MTWPSILFWDPLSTRDGSRTFPAIVLLQFSFEIFAWIRRLKTYFSIHVLNPSILFWDLLVFGSERLTAVKQVVPSILFWDLHSRSGGWTVVKQHMGPSILFWDLLGIIYSVLNGKLYLYPFNSLLRSSRWPTPPGQYLLPWSFNSLLRSSQWWWRVTGVKIFSFNSPLRSSLLWNSIVEYLNNYCIDLQFSFEIF